MKYYNLKVNNDGIDGEREFYFPAIDCPGCGHWGSTELITCEVSADIIQSNLLHKPGKISREKFSNLGKNIFSIDPKWVDSIGGINELVPGRRFIPYTVLDKLSSQMAGFVGCNVIENSLRDAIINNKISGVKFYKVKSKFNDNYSEMVCSFTSGNESRPLAITENCPICSRLVVKFSDSISIYKNMIPKVDAFYLYGTYSVIINESFLSILKSECSEDNFSVDSINLI